MAGGQPESPILQVHFNCAKILLMETGRPVIMAAIVGAESKTNWIKSSTDEKGGELDFEMSFPLNHQMLQVPENFNLVCNIMHYCENFWLKGVGQLKIPLSSLLDLTSEKNSYPVISDEGEERGSIIISHKLLISTVASPAAIPVHAYSHFLELNFHRGFDLLHPLFSRKARPYVEAEIVSHGHDTTRNPNWVKTNTDEQGGTNPVWEQVIRLGITQEEMDVPKDFDLIFKVKHSGKKMGNRKLGNVKASLEDLVVKAAVGVHVPYPVMASNGVEKGKIIVSHRLVANTASPPPPPGVIHDGGVANTASPPPPPGVIHDGGVDNTASRVTIVAGVTTIIAGAYKVIKEVVKEITQNS